MTWLADFHERSEYNEYPIVRRTRGGFGYKVGNDIVSNFVGHPVHYNKGNGEWLPITLAYTNGHFEGSDFGWNEVEKCVTYKGLKLYKPNAITFDGLAYPLNFIFDEPNHRMVADVPFGTYEIIFREGKVQERFTVPNPMDGILVFDVPNEKQPKELHKNERKILKDKQDKLHNQKGDGYVLSLDMTYPLVIDPDYAAHTGDGFIYGTDATYATARNTSTAFDITSTFQIVGQNAGYIIYRSFLKFDTSGIPDADTVTQANAKLTYVAGTPATNYIIIINDYDWSARDPIAAGNREANYDAARTATADANWRDTSSGFVANTQYTSDNLSTTWIVKTGYTYYSLVSSRDVAGTAPTGDERVNIHTQNSATPSYYPILTVVHSAAGRGNFFAMF